MIICLCLLKKPPFSLAFLVIPVALSLAYPPHGGMPEAVQFLLSILWSGLVSAERAAGLVSCSPFSWLNCLLVPLQGQSIPNERQKAKLLLFSPSYFCPLPPAISLFFWIFACAFITLTFLMLWGFFLYTVFSFASLPFSICIHFFQSPFFK